MKYVEHKFLPGHTINAVIRLINRHDLSDDEMDELNHRFNILNGDVFIRVGTVAKIPLEK